jgi:hypothetical protein
VVEVFKAIPLGITLEQKEPRRRPMQEVVSEIRDIASEVIIQVVERTILRFGRDKSAGAIKKRKKLITQDEVNDNPLRLSLLNAVFKIWGKVVASMD